MNITSKMPWTMVRDPLNILCLGPRGIVISGVIRLSSVMARHSTLLAKGSSIHCLLLFFIVISFHFHFVEQFYYQVLYTIIDIKKIPKVSSQFYFQFLYTIDVVFCKKICYTLVLHFVILYCDTFLCMLC